MTFNTLPETRRKLILHRITRALIKELQQDDIVVLYSFAYLEATLHKTAYENCSAEYVKESISVNMNMLTQILTSIQNRRGFNWAEMVQEILKEEGVSNPTDDDLVAITLTIIAGSVT